VEAKVSAEGRPEMIRVIKSIHPEVDARAVEAVRQWRFQPATLDGKPVAVYFVVSVNVDWR
jgi:TonB family protein